MQQVAPLIIDTYNEVDTGGVQQHLMQYLQQILLIQAVEMLVLLNVMLHQILELSFPHLRHFNS